MRWAFPCTLPGFHHARGGRYTRIVKRSTRIVVGVLVALVMAGTPAMATACAMLCSTVVTADPDERSDEHGAHAAMAQTPAQPAPAVQAHHHEEASPGDADEPTAAARLTASSTHECCDDASLARLAPATRRDPGVSSPRISLLSFAASPAAAITAVIVDRTTGPQFEPPALSRAPLVLRI
jgi:hypothetical protein